MTSQRHAKQPSVLSLPDECIYLAREGPMRSYTKTAEFFRSVGESAEFADGRVLALYDASTPQDVHYPVWEMHPEGDELLVLASGSLTVEFRETGVAERRVVLPAKSAVVVPAGTWHRLLVHERSVVIAITPRHGTVHHNG